MIIYLPCCTLFLHLEMVDTTMKIRPRLQLTGIKKMSYKSNSSKCHIVKKEFHCCSTTPYCMYTWMLCHTPFSVNTISRRFYSKGNPRKRNVSLIWMKAWQLLCLSAGILAKEESGRQDEEVGERDSSEKTILSFLCEWKQSRWRV